MSMRKLQESSSGVTYNLSGDAGDGRRRQDVAGSVDDRLEVGSEPRHHQKPEFLVAARQVRIAFYSLPFIEN